MVYIKYIPINNKYTQIYIHIWPVHLQFPFTLHHWQTGCILVLYHFGHVVGDRIHGLHGVDGDGVRCLHIKLTTEPIPQFCQTEVHLRIRGPFPLKHTGSGKMTTGRKWISPNVGFHLGLSNGWIAINQFQNVCAYKMYVGVLYYLFIYMYLKNTGIHVYF